MTGVQTCALPISRGNGATATDLLAKLGLPGPCKAGQLQGHPTTTAGDAAKAGLALAIGSDLWVLTAEGDGAPR